MNASPEHLEFTNKSGQLSGLESELWQMELDFNSLQAELLTFQRRYNEFVVRRMYELDCIEVEIAEYLVASDPSNPEYRQTLNKSKEQVAEAEKSFSTS